MPRYAELVYNGFWFAPERRMLQALVDESQASVTGEVRLKLYKGNTIVTGRRSPHSLYSMKHVTFEDDEGAYDQIGRPGLHQAERAAAAPRRHGRAAGRRAVAMERARAAPAARRFSWAAPARHPALPLRGQHPPGAALPLRAAHARPRLAVAWSRWCPSCRAWRSVLAFEAMLGLVLLTEFVLRHLASRRPVRDLLRPTHLLDLAAIALAAGGAHLSRTAWASCARCASCGC